MSEPIEPDWFQLIAQQRGMPPEWRWFSSEWKGEGEHAVMLVKGGVPGAPFARGKNKGKPNPANRTQVAELVISREHMDAIKSQWQVKTGKCAKCAGSGQICWRWSKEGGRETRDCKACAGTGRATP